MSARPEPEELAESLKRYIGTSCELFRLEAAERASVIVAGIAASFLVLTAGTLFILFLSLGAGFYLSGLLGNTWSGFGIVAGFYGLVCLCLLLGRKKLVERPVRDSIIRRVFSKN